MSRADTPAAPSPDQPVGVFDSGMGGLTVLRALRARLPAEDLLYLGDTARLPYGTKSAETVSRYAVQAAGVLVERGVKALVVACNTASAVALPALAAAFPTIPVSGVVLPGARAAVMASASGRIGVLATESTVRGGAYQRAILGMRRDARVHARACGLFVALAEEGLVDGPVAEHVATHLLNPWLSGHWHRPDTVVLGCTHFPAMAATIDAVLGGDTAIVDSAVTTAEDVAATLGASGLLGAGGGPGTTQFLATDDPARFARVGGVFLGTPLRVSDVEPVDL